MNKMADLFKNVFWYIIKSVWTVFLYILKYVPRFQEAYDEALVRLRRPLPWIYLIRIKAKDVDIEPRFLPLLPDRFKTQKMCEKAVEKYQWLLKYVPDWFVTHQQIKIWHDNDDYCNDDELIEWYEGYHKCSAQKAKIKKELMPITWIHQGGGIGVFLKMKNERQKNFGHKYGFFVPCDQIQKFFFDQTK